MFVHSGLLEELLQTPSCCEAHAARLLSSQITGLSLLPGCTAAGTKILFLPLHFHLHPSTALPFHFMFHFKKHFVMFFQFSNIMETLGTPLNITLEIVCPSSHGFLISLLATHTMLDLVNGSGKSCMYNSLWELQKSHRWKEGGSKKSFQGLMQRPKIFLPYNLLFFSISMIT